MTKTKIQGKFYPLKHDEWLRACRELTPAQRDVLYFVRTLDPYGDGLDISIAEIARQLSTDKRTVHRSTVSRALKELDANGFIDLELLMVRLNIKAKGIHYWDSEALSLPFGNASGVQDASLRAMQGASETSALPRDNKRDHDATVLPRDNERDHDATSVITTQQARSLRNKREPQASPNHDSNSLRLNKTYKDFIDSLCKTKREKFLEFGLRKAAELPKPPALPKKWIERNWQELREEFFTTSSQTPNQVDPAQSEREQQEQINAARKELAELQKRQQSWTQQGQGARG
ncbi:MarR family transcriptional regulator [Microcoleus sp. FACHB-SPT15]|uniref:MarR family transcriptional regulator n=1 Tax=Microcoleus sp. FACHB-SPT15 TaxID=2692830 RepID=UPI00177C4CB2|nr:helix-turn-helix domain-containing protein [Microcoleus sp. FACHB-SPT15]MBD1808534.1 MarR family transcriptional regulator [Microcoleus sp. FACHB-SPT15]